MDRVCKTCFFENQDWYSVDFGPRNPVLQKTKQRKYATSAIVERVARTWHPFCTQVFVVISLLLFFFFAHLHKTLRTAVSVLS